MMVTAHAMSNLFGAAAASTGDHSVYIRSGEHLLNPDFMELNGIKKVVEVFGDYWHGRKEALEVQKEDVRTALFKAAGFDTLILWEGWLKAHTHEEIASTITTFLSAPQEATL